MRVAILLLIVALVSLAALAPSAAALRPPKPAARPGDGPRQPPPAVRRDGPPPGMPETISMADAMRMVDGSRQKEVCPASRPCPRGMRAVPKEGRVVEPVTTCPIGNMPEGLTLPNDVDFGECCGQLHVCYNTCNAVRGDCDNELNTCMRLKCDAAADGEACRQAVEVYAMSTRMIGCKVFNDAQRVSCGCVTVGRGRPGDKQRDKRDKRNNAATPEVAPDADQPVQPPEDVRGRGGKRNRKAGSRSDEL